MSNRSVGRCLSLFVTFAAAMLLAASARAASSSLTITPITWNIIGLDSNDPATGPYRFPVGARVCSTVATTNVAVEFEWDSANAFIALRAGSLDTINIAAISAGGCADAYFEVEVDKDPSAFDTARRYHITATDGSGDVSTPTPREFYVEHLISQSRNSVTDVKYGPDAMNLVSVAPGSGMSLVVGNTYAIQLLGGTATQGYNQFEAFINFSNTVFQILSVETTYSANNSPNVTGPAPAIHDQLYADACGWENDPNSPNYRDCVGGDFKSGGSDVVTTYTIKIIGGGGTSETLTSLLYDFSGSSYHYNADFGTGARIANIIDPTTATISKSFSPNPAGVNGLAVLTFILTNPNPGTLGGYNFVDNLPANLQVASTPGVSTSGCGTPTVSAVAGSGTISFSNGTLAANSNCVVSVNVTPTTTGTFNNTTNNLFIDAVDTGDNAAASLTVNTDPPGAGLCGQTLASWTVPNGTTANPPDLTGGVPTTKAANVATATLAASVPADSSILGSSGHLDTTSWRTWGYKNDNQTLDFTIDTQNYTNVQMSFWMANPSPANGPTSVTVSVNAGAGFGAPVLTIANPVAAFTQYTINLTGLTNTGGNTVIRIAGTGANADSSGASLNFDDMTFTGCTTAVDPTISKSFSPDPIAVNGTSTLTFTLTNTNATQLTGAKFIDTLPTGLQVAATPAAATTCGGSPSWAPAAAATTLNFGQTTGATIPASGSCTVSVNVTATTAGPHGNVSGFLFTTESGTANGTVASDTLTAVLPPVIAKQFAPSPILAGGTSTLTFTLTNPNQDNALSGVAFSDTFPVAPGAMTVAAVPAASTSGCGSPTFSPSAGSGSIAFSGGSIAAGGTCTVTVNVTAPAVGTYNNTSGSVSHVINAQTVNGNTTSDSLAVDPPDPSISLLKQVSTDPGGPWTSFVAVASGDVYYRFTVENIGDVPLTSINITDDTLDVSACNAAFTGLTLQVADAFDDDHIVTCITGAVPVASGSHDNTATAEGTYSGNPFTSDDSTATYATTGLTLDKSSAGTFTNAGDAVNYSYLVTNSGFAPLVGPVTVTDDKIASVTCPAVNTAGDLDNFLDPGEFVTCSGTYLATGGDVAAGFVTNTASAQADGVESNTDSVTVLSTASADVSVTKTLTTVGPYTAGDSVSFDIVVSNDGPSMATNIQVTDVDTNLTITNVSGSGCVALPCTIAALASGADTTITVTATIDAAGAFENQATVDADQPDPTPGNNTDDDGDTAVASADVSLTKTLTTVGPYTVGDTVSFDIVVANDGPSTATNIQVTDLDTNLTITNVSGSGCAALPCTIAVLSSGTDTTITVTATIDAAGAFANQATADADEPDPDTNNNTDDDGDTAAASADVSVVKTLTTAGPYTIGDTVSFDIVVSNDGPSPATNIQVTDVDLNLTITNVSGSGCAALPCTIAALASGADTTITVTATIDAAGAFENEANADADEPDPDTNNNTDDDGDTAGASADVSVVKTLTTAGPYTVGQTVSFDILVANDGPSTATNIQVTDLDTNLTITNVSGSGCVALPCTIPALLSGTDTTITVTATIDSNGAFSNEATVDADEPDPDTNNNTDDDGDTAAASADVSVVKTLTTVGPYTVGDSVTFDILVANDGPSTATNIQVTDADVNLTITNVSGSGCAALPCTIAALASGADTTITVTATIDAAGAFENEATADADEPDPDTNNNTDDDGDTAAASADVSVVKTLTTAGPYTIGDTVSFDILVTNDGPSPATNIQVTDADTNLTITNVSGSGCVALPCTIAALASGADTTITVTATIDAAGAFENEATVDADEPDPDTNNNTDDDGDTADASADVSVVKTLTTAGPYTVGDTVSFDILVANDGPSTATNIQVTDLDTNLTITNVSGSGCVALPCTIAALASGTDTTITVTATIDSNGAFSNEATADADEPDPDTNNNTDDDGDIAGASADVSVVKTLTTNGPYTVGDTVSFDIVVANDGPSPATNIQVTDADINLTITNVSGSGCAALPCTIAALASGADTTITVTATIDAAGAFENEATADADEPDPDTNNNTDDDGDTAGASADVSVVKTLTTAGPYTVGDTVSFDILVANDGPSTATNIQVTDVDTNLTITNVSGSGCAALPCTIAALASGADTTITVTATIDAAGAFENEATADADEPDPDTNNNTDDDGDTAGASADVSVVKTLTTAGPYTIGDTVSFDILVTNDGPSPATNIQVTDVDTNLTITNVSGSGCAALPCTIAALASGADTTITVTATIDADGAFENEATVDADEPDPDTTNNTDDDGDIAGASADVSVVKTLTTVGPYTVGDTVTFEIEVANAGPSTATNIQVTDLDTNLTIINVSGSGCAALPCTIAALSGDTDTTITVTATIDAAGAFENEATVDADEPDPDTTNNTDDDGDTAAASADVSVVKTLTTAGPYIVGQTVSFDIVVSNDGPSPATNIQVTDVDTNITITNVSGSGCAALPCTIAALASGADTTITVTATIEEEGDFGNEATVDADEPDPDTTNNTDDDGDTAGASADVSVVKTLTTAGPYTDGDTVSFDILVANDGPSTATNIQVTDVDTNLTITNVSGSGCAALPCTIAALPPGTDTTITVTATIDADGAFENEASADADEPDPDTTNNTDDDGDIAGTSADVSVVKTLTTAGPYTVGDSVTFEIEVANAGPSTATNIQVTDLDTNLTITNVSGSGCAALPCTIAALSADTDTTITVTATIDAAGAFENEATVDADEPDPDTTNNTDDAGDTAAASADISVVKTLTTAGPYTVGQTVSFDIVVDNDGPSTATNIQVTDVDTNLTITNVSGSGCAALPCTIASLASGADTTITVTATIDADGAFENEATVDADEPDPDPSDNTDDDGDTAGASADISVVKTLTTAGPYTVGQSVSFDIVVDNDGPSTATNIQVTDVDTNLTITNVSGSGCAALPCTIAALSSGTDTTITVTATIDANGAFENEATVDADEPDPDPSDNTDDDGDIAGASADVSVVKTLTTAGPYTVGQTVSFDIVVDNDGPSTATNIQVTDVDTSLTITNVSGSGCAALPCTIASLASGADTTITVTATIDAAGAFENEATVDADEPDPDPSDNTDDDGDTAGASADLSLTKTLTTVGPYTVGDSVSFDIVVDNDGPSTATNIQVTDVDTNLTITNVSGSGCAALPCTIASLASGADTTITVTATIDAAGAFENEATVDADEPDPDPSDNTDDDGDTAGASADLSVVKTLTTAGPYTIGDSVTYSIVIANAGPSTATSIDVTDTPSNLTITNVSGGGCAALPCTIASLASGADTTITVTATIDGNGEFSNSATATADEPDPDPDDNDDEDGDTAGPSANVSVVKTLTTAGPYTIGDSVTYSIVIANAGPSTATSIDVTDTPSNLTITNVGGAGCVALPCTIASLLSGADTTITVTATINGNGAFSNSATATADEPDPDPDDNDDEDGDTAGPSADVSVVKTLTTAGPYTIGDSVTYSIVIANAGPSTATSIDVTDTPSNLTITNVGGAGCVALPCTIASLLSGADTTITVTATINGNGAFSNSATATADEPDPDPDDNDDEDGDTAGPSADVSVVKTLTTAGPYTIGDSVTYSIVIANAGPSTATSIEVTDTPSNLTITNVGGSGCVALPCTIASLLSGADTTITVTATINSNGAFSNSATATADEPDPDPDDNDDEDGDTAGPSADVSVVKTLTTAGPYTIGDSVTYAIVIANAGPSTATSIDVTDTPSNLTITNVSGACAALPCTIASLASGADATITVTATINSNGAFSNAATATADEPDPDPDDNDDDDGDTAGPSADVSLVKTLDTAGPFSIGQSVTYTLLIANAGPSIATSIEVTDTPSNLTVTSVSGACPALPCTILSLGVGSSVNVTVTATINGAGAFDNSATALAAEPDPDLTNNTDDDGNLVGVSADVSIDKTLDTAGPFNVGQEITYTLLISNAGPSPATSIEVTDSPSNLTITNVSGGGCAALPCTIASLAVGGSASVTVTATIDAVGDFDNVATANAVEPDPDPDNNTDDDGNGGTAGASVDLAIVKTSSLLSMVVGDTFNFTLVVTNNGPDTATNVVVTDPLPANFALTTVTTTQGSCTGTASVTCMLGTMLNGGSVTITMTGRAMGAGMMSNTATVESNESEAVTANNSSSASPVAAAATLSNVPTVSEWGLIILAMLLAAVAVTRMRLS